MKNKIKINNIYLSGSYNFCKTIINKLEENETNRNFSGYENLVISDITIIQSDEKRDILLYSIRINTRKGVSERNLIISTLEPALIDTKLIHEAFNFSRFLQKSYDLYLDYFVACGIEAIKNIEEQIEKKLLNAEKLFYSLHFGFLIAHALKNYWSSLEMNSKISDPKENKILFFFSKNFGKYKETNPDVYRFIMLSTISEYIKTDEKLSKLFHEIHFNDRINGKEAHLEDLENIEYVIKEIIRNYIEGILDYENHIFLLMDLYTTALPLYLVGQK